MCNEREKEEAKPDAGAMVPLDEAVISTIETADLTSVIAEYAEIGLDAALGDGLLKEIPVVGTLVGLAKVGMTIRDRMFLDKLLKFLRGLQNVPEEDRRSMVQNLQADPGYGRNVGQHLIELLERLDGHRKPQMIAKVFEAYLSERVDIRTFNQLILAIERIPFFEIDSVRRVHEQSGEGIIDVSDATFQALENAGLMHAVSAYGGLGYRVSELCQDFIDLELDRVDE